MSAAGDFFSYRALINNIYLTKWVPQAKILRFQGATKGILYWKLASRSLPVSSGSENVLSWPPPLGKILPWPLPLGTIFTRQSPGGYKIVPSRVKKNTGSQWEPYVKSENFENKLTFSDFTFSKYSIFSVENVSSMFFPSRDMVSSLHPACF